jgi:hypothetical protein
VDVVTTMSDASVPLTTLEYDECHGHVPFHLSCMRKQPDPYPGWGRRFQTWCLDEVLRRGYSRL